MAVNFSLIDPLLYNHGNSFWGSVRGQPVTLTYRFLDSLPTWYAGLDESNGFAPMDASQRTATLAALNTWSEVANIRFVAALGGNRGDIDIGAYRDESPDVLAHAYHPDNPIIFRGDIWINRTNWDNSRMRPGGFDYLALVHESGHAMGLKHPGNYNAGSSSGTPGPYLSSGEENRRYTVMSYSGHPQMIGVEPSAPMLYDIAAMQYLYGANLSTRAGDTTYDGQYFWGGSARDFVATIWDGGGRDAIDASAFSLPTAIDLQEGQFSSIGSYRGSRATNNLAIAYGAVIENATGGSGSDSLTGNAAGNALTGGAGSDFIDGKGGNDQLRGGDGSDIYQFGPDWGEDVIDDASRGDSVRFVGVTGLIGSQRDGSNLVLSQGGNRLTVLGYYTGAEMTANLGWSFRSDSGDIPMPTTNGGTPDANDPGGSRDAARIIGALDSANAPGNPNTAIAGNVGTGSDSDDYFRFDVRERSMVSLRMTPQTATGNADLELQDGTGRVLAASRNLAGREDLVQTQLEAGTYYARVGKVSGSTEYRLSATAEGLNAQPDTSDDTAAGAIDLTPLRSTARAAENWVGRGDARDYFKFTLTGASSVSLGLAGLAADANLQLNNSLGTRLASSLRLGTAEESIVRNLDAGEYYVLVSQATATAETAYRLTASASTISVDGAGNTKDRARSIGLLDSRERVFSDWVSGTLDANDYYRFTVAGASTLNLALDGLGANVDVEVIDARSGVMMGRSARLGTAEETIGRSIAAGDYFVRVLPVGVVDSSYRLRLSATNISTDGAANTKDLARDIGTLDAREQVFNDWVSGPLDANDYYRFTLPATATLRLNLSGLGADANVQVIDSRGLVAASGLRTGTMSESVAANLPAGNYWVRVYPGTAAAETAYSLSLRANAVVADFAGNTRDRAFNEGTLDTRTREYSEWISGALDPNDWYRFTLSGVTQLRMQLSSSEVNADLQLVNSLGTVLATSAAARGVNDVIERSLAAGTYYARVYPATAAESGNYRLTIGATDAIVDAAPNSRDQARAIGVLDAREQVFNDWVSGTLDANDWYMFSLTENARVTLGLGGLTGNADFQLLDRNGVLIAASAQAGTASESLVRVLGAGDYYVRVLPVGTTATNYRLSLKADSSIRLYFGEERIGTAGNDTLSGIFRGMVFGGPGDDNLLANDNMGSQRMVGGSGADMYVAPYNGAITILDNGASDGDILVADRIRLGRSTTHAQIIDNRHLMLWDKDQNNVIQYVYLDDWQRVENRIEYYFFDSQKQVYNSHEQFYNAVMALRPVNVSWAASGSISSLPSPFNTASGINALMEHMAARGREVETLLTTNTDGVNDNDPAHAQNLGTLSSTAVVRSGKVSDLDTSDYYRFTLAAPISGEMRLEVSGGDADLYVYASNGTSLLYFSEQYGSDALTGTLEAGQYYIAVEHYEGLVEYTLSLTPTVLPTQTPDNQPSDARNLGDLSAAASGGLAQVSDRVDSRDPQDYFKFSLSARAQVDLQLTGLSSDADVYLLNGDGVTQIAYSNRAGSYDEQITRNLDPGTYYVKVKAYASNGTNYQLSVRASGAGSNDPGDTLSTARALGNLLDPARGGVTSVSDRVSSLDEKDYFRFSLSGPARVNLSLNGMSGGDADVSLLRANGELVDFAAYSANPGTLEDRVSRVLDTGDYYVLVSQFDGATPYTLRLEALGPATDAAGNTLATAKVVGDMNNTPYIFEDRVDAIDRIDYYRFTLAEQTSVGMQIDNLGEDADLSLLGADGSLVAASRNRGTTEEKLTRTLAAGTYYIQVSPYGSAETNYRLILNTGPDETDILAGELALKDDELRRGPYDRIFRSASGDRTSVYEANAGLAERFEVADDSLMRLRLADNGLRDAVFANGIGLNRTTSHFAELDGGDLLAWDTASRQAFLIHDWRNAGLRPGRLELAGAVLNFEQFANALTANKLLIAGLTSAGLDLTRDMNLWAGAASAGGSLRPAGTASLLAATPD